MIHPRSVFGAILVLAMSTPALAQDCKKTGNAVTCNDGRTGIFTGDSIVWPDGTKSSAASQHPSVMIGNKSSVRVGPGVFVGSPSGRGSVPLDDPNSPNKRNCAILEGIPYCH